MLVMRSLWRYLKGNRGDNASGALFECVDGSLNFSNMFFGFGGVHNAISHLSVYGIAKFHIHMDILYYHATYGIYFHNSF